MITRTDSAIRVIDILILSLVITSNTLSFTSLQKLEAEIVSLRKMSR